MKRLFVLVASGWVVYRLLRYWHYKKLGVYARRDAKKGLGLFSNWDDQLLVQHEQRMHQRFVQFVKTKPVELAKDHANELFEYCVVQCPMILKTAGMDELIACLSHLLRHVDITRVHHLLFRDRFQQYMVIDTDYSKLVFALVVQGRLWSVYPIFYAMFRALLHKQTTFTLSTLCDLKVQVGNETLTCLELLWDHLENVQRLKERELATMLGSALNALCENCKNKEQKQEQQIEVSTA